MAGTFQWVLVFMADERGMTLAFAIILGMIVLIPVLAILIDSPLSDALARRIAKGDQPGAGARLDAVEREMEYLTQTVESLRDEAAFVRALVEEREPEAALPPAPEAAGTTPSAEASSGAEETRP